MPSTIEKIAAPIIVWGLVIAMIVLVVVSILLLIDTLSVVAKAAKACWVANQPEPDPNTYHCSTIVATIIPAPPTPPSEIRPLWQFHMVWPAGQVGKPRNVQWAALAEDWSQPPTFYGAWDIDPVEIQAWVDWPTDINADGKEDSLDVLIHAQRAGMTLAELHWVARQLGYCPEDLNESGRVTTTDYSRIKAALGQRCATQPAPTAQPPRAGPVTRPARHPTTTANAAPLHRGRVSGTAPSGGTFPPAAGVTTQPQSRKEGTNNGP